MMTEEKVQAAYDEYTALMGEVYTRGKDRFKKLSFKAVNNTSDLEQIDFKLTPDDFKLEGLHKFLEKDVKKPAKEPSLKTPLKQPKPGAISS